MSSEYNIPNTILDIQPVMNREFNQYTIENEIKSNTNLLKVQEQNQKILNNILNICNSDKTDDTEVILFKNTIMDNNRKQSNIEMDVFTVKYEFNDGIGTPKIQDCNGYSRISYSKHKVMLKYKEIFTMLEECYSIGEILIEKWDKGTYVSFNYYVNDTVDRNNKIIVYSEPFNNNPISMSIGEKYWVSQPEKTRIKTISQHTLIKIIKEENIYRFVFDGIPIEDSPYSMIAKGNVGVSKDNINRIEDHIIISKFKSSFIKEALTYSAQLLDLSNNAPDNDISVTESIQDLIKLI